MKGWFRRVEEREEEEDQEEVAWRGLDVGWGDILRGGEDEGR